MKFKWILVMVVSIFSATGLPSFAGKEGVGGGNPRKIDATAIQLLIQGQDLKIAMNNYLRTVRLEQIADSRIRRILKQVSVRGALQKDVEISRYEASSRCMADSSDSVPASTEVGKLGGKICFNLEKLAQQYSSLSSEELMIRLASLAFHEHIHHFQLVSESREINEKEANEFSAYVQLTAKATRMPSLKWVSPAGTSYARRLPRECAEQNFGVDTIREKIVDPASFSQEQADELIKSLLDYSNRNSEDTCFIPTFVFGHGYGALSALSAICRQRKGSGFFYPGDIQVVWIPESDLISSSTLALIRTSSSNIACIYSISHEATMGCFNTTSETQANRDSAYPAICMGRGCMDNVSLQAEWLNAQ
jgi:hypothetical protein